MSRHRSSSKRPPPEIGLHMECEEEELEPSQTAYYAKAEKEYNDIQAKLDNYIKNMKAEVVEKGENCLVLQLNATPHASTPQISTPSSSGKATRQSVPSSQNFQPVPAPGIITRSNAVGSSTYLVVDPRLGFVVNQLPGTQSEQVASPTPSKTVSSGRTRQQPTPTGSVMVTTRAKSSLKKQNEPEPLSSPVSRTRQQEKTKSQSSPPLSQQTVYSHGGISSPGNYKVKVNAKAPIAPQTKPNESTAIGGLSAGGKTQKGADEPGSSKSGADSREVTFGKLTGKTFPSLVVVARPNLKVKIIPQTTANQERSTLDNKVKGVLMYSSSKFIEWLIQQGLIKSEQFCQVHMNSDLTPVKLKLGMYSDVSKFPYSGGYVWISDCCPQQFVSVFSGSLFEGAPHPPTTLLKLIYHWACQTNVQNVVQWVKVDNFYLKNFYTSMRAVCTQAVHEKFRKMGGAKKKIEVGVISLGTTSQDGNKRQVKVEVLGVMDLENKMIRLRAAEPLSEERSFKRRFVKILEPLEEWVHKDSIILTDFTVAKAALNAMGFNTVHQVTNDTKLSNQNVMEYLRKIIPRMFQNTLSLLSRQIIQQFLDELVWREMWGSIPSQAFYNVVTHLAEQTKLDVAENFINRLNRVAANPFKKWNYAAWKTVGSSSSRTVVKVQQKAPSDISDTIVLGKGIRTRKRAAEQSVPDIITLPTAKKVPRLSTKEKEKQKKEEKLPKKEISDKLPDDIAKFLNYENQISLENYYYGSRNGDEEISHSATGPFNVKCCVCNKRFTNNIVLMKHMILHCQSEPVLVIDLKKVHQCGNCFLGFNTNTALKIHLQEVHSEVDGALESNLICHICEEKFSTENSLLCHMYRTHVELEMPYVCGACKFRTSVYKIFVEHFVEVHRKEDHVFCPYCLKLVTFSYKGEPIMSNVFFYMSHLEKHQRLTLVKDCSRCQLNFIHKGILDQHLEADHGSWKNDEKVTSIEKLYTGLLMPEPGEAIKPAPMSKTCKVSKSKSVCTLNRFKSLQLYGVDESMACVECEGSLTFSDHFTGSYNCVKCRYSSCCEKAMFEHFTIFHESFHPQFTKGKPIVLPQETFCVCGFSTRSGNRIAKHLALCERETAYPTKEAALAVRCKELEDFDEKSKGEGQNVLNMLGLVRKSPEATVGGVIESVKTEESENLVEDEEAIKLEVEETNSQEESELQQDATIVSKTIELEKPTTNEKEVPEEQSLEEKTEAEETETLEEESLEIQVEEKSSEELKKVEEMEVEKTNEDESEVLGSVEVEEKMEVDETVEEVNEEKEKCLVDEERTKGVDVEKGEEVNKTKDENIEESNVEQESKAESSEDKTEALEKSEALEEKS